MFDTPRMRSLADLQRDPEAPAPVGPATLPLDVQRVRTFDTPEFAGMRFLEVEAKTALNRVRGMPFGWSINPYRGCSHSCSYCVAGDTPILMGHGRTKPIADLRVGDEVYGTISASVDRRYVVTRVLDRQRQIGVFAHDQRVLAAKLETHLREHRAFADRPLDCLARRHRTQYGEIDIVARDGAIWALFSASTSPRSVAAIEICIQPCGWSKTRRAASSGIAAYPRPPTFRLLVSLKIPMIGSSVRPVGPATRTLSPTP